MGGCGKEADVEHPYQVYSSAVSNFDLDTAGADFFAEKLCVTSDMNFGTDQTDSQVAQGAGVFNLDRAQVEYSQNLFEKLYPASTTKILTAYIILKYGNPDDMVTVSENAVNQASDSSVCGLKAGDVISVRDLLYGLMLASGNDAAIALAEYYSGSIEAFAEVMNQEALKLGASGSHFVNPNGLPDENHYTTVYDMYLMFSAAVNLDEFVTIISTPEFETSYTDAGGGTVTKKWKNTNQYVNGDRDMPQDVHVIGGKTGTTHAAGYCLCLYSTNAENERIISIVFKADGRSNLYLLMDQILSGFAN